METEITMSWDTAMTFFKLEVAPTTMYGGLIQVCAASDIIASKATCDNVKDELKSDCGHYGITEKSCKSKGAAGLIQNR